MKAWLAAVALALAACATKAPPPERMDQTASLAAAESAFAAHSVREDMRAAFLAAFAADGVVVRDGWTNSNNWLRDRPAPKIVLDWRPQYVEVAASGDLGLSTGPWKITSRAKPDQPPAFGQFVSVWRRQGGGPWKVAVDLGIQHAGPALWNAPLESRQDGPGAASGEGLSKAEARFAELARSQGARGAYGALAADNIRYYRNGHPPVVGKGPALASPTLPDDRLVWIPERVETARSGDLGYARGAYAAASDPAKALGWYLRVWRREGAAWRIAMDVTSPAPAKR